MERLTVPVRGMHCTGCVGKVERALAGVPGVRGPAVNLATEQATFELDPTRAKLDEVRRAVAAAGYELGEPRTGTTAAGVAADHDTRARDARATGRRAVVGTILSIPVLLGSMPQVFPWAPAVLRDPWLLLALTTPVQVWVGWPFHRGFLHDLRYRSASMSTLVSLGTNAAFFYSLAVTLWPHTFMALGGMTYYETAAAVITLVVLGRWMERRARERTSDAIGRLVALTPRATRVVRDGAEVDVPTPQVVVGDWVRIRPGERLPVDGVVVEGASTVDESMVTGESVPVAKMPGDRVIAGTMNRTGSFVFRASRVGAETTLARIIALVEAAQGSRAPIQRLADRVAAIFVPLVLALATLTFLVWWLAGPAPSALYALVNAVAVLVIACPCAMGLATPTAIMVGTGRGAEHGILISSAAALETLHRVNEVVFDKTGTLTVGRLELTDVVAVPPATDDDILALAAAVEQGSEHPLGEAILGAAKVRGLALPAVTAFTSVPGRGLEGIAPEGRVLLGNRTLMTERGVDVAPLEARARALAEAGRTPVYVALAGAVIGLVAAGDHLKPEAPSVVQALRARGVDAAMLTGDTRATAAAIARAAGIERVFAEVLPDAKARLVRELRAAGRRVAMVGDGVNDAPALAQADVGIAMGAGSDIAADAADVTLMRSDLRDVLAAIDLSRQTIRVIRENLAWAFGYNVVLLPVAAGALYPLWGVLLSPILAGLAMALSSVSVVANSLRLKRWHPR